jgi:lipoate---protein ligase
MRLVDFHSNIPEEQIALDELLLQKAETEEIGETLRFWTPGTYFIVVGRSSKIEEDCHLDKCSKDKIKIIRRISGGGTILQGPGCLNYSVILSYDSNEMYSDIKKSYTCVLKKLSDGFRSNGCNAELFPLSDIAIDNKKISGNAQARKKKYFLQHGTFLFDFDINKISYYLKHPNKEPEYRKNRGHAEFLANMPIGFLKIEDTIKKSFLDSEDKYDMTDKDKKDLNILADKKYFSDNWNLMF